MPHMTHLITFNGWNYCLQSACDVHNSVCISNSPILWPVGIVTYKSLGTLLSFEAKSAVLVVSSFRVGMLRGYLSCLYMVFINSKCKQRSPALQTRVVWFKSSWLKSWFLITNLNHDLLEEIKKINNPATDYHIGQFGFAQQMCTVV